jgi:hypothetical protein
MVSINDLLKEIDDMLVSLDSINLEPTLLDYESQTENQNECCCDKQQLLCIQES